MSAKKWDVYVYSDVNIDIVIPGVEKFPEPGQEDEARFVPLSAAVPHYLPWVSANWDSTRCFRGK